MGHRHLHWPASTSTQYHFSFSRSPFFWCSLACVSTILLSALTPERPLFSTNKHKYTSCHSQWSIVFADCFILALTGCNESNQSEQIPVRATRPCMSTIIWHLPLEIVGDIVFNSNNNNNNYKIISCEIIQTCSIPSTVVITWKMS